MSSPFLGLIMGPGAPGKVKEHQIWTGNQGQGNAEGQQNAVGEHPAAVFVGLL